MATMELRVVSKTSCTGYDKSNDKTESCKKQSVAQTILTTLNEKVGFIIPTTRTRTFSMSARRFSEVGAVQFRRRVGIGILLGWLGV